MNPFNRKSKFFNLLSLMMLILELASCSSMNNDKENNPSFQIAFLQGEKVCSSPDLGNNIETSWQVLQESFPSKVIYTIRLDKIESYNWKDQSITLTNKEAKEFSDFVSNGSNSSLICPYAFLVLVDETPTYGGQIVFYQSPQRFQFPVIYIQSEDDRVRLLLRPYHSVLQIEPNDPAWQIIKDENIKKIMSDSNKLEE